jgi:hypothetical protein
VFSKKKFEKVRGFDADSYRRRVVEALEDKFDGAEVSVYAKDDASDTLLVEGDNWYDRDNVEGVILSVKAVDENENGIS